MLRYKQICIMISPDLEEKIRNEATKNERSFSQMLRIILSEYFKENQK